MILENVDGFNFDFTDAIDAFVFDGKYKDKPHYHGVPMKAVDVIVERDKEYYFIEIKNPHDPSLYNHGTDGYQWLKSYLIQKYRDSYLFRLAEDKTGKPIHYLCLLILENALLNKLRDDLNRELPVGKASKLWKKEIATTCNVVNIAGWKRNFPNWKLT